MSERPISHGMRAGRGRLPDVAFDPVPGSCSELPPAVVVAVDGSDCSLRAVSYAVGLARRQGAVLVAVHGRRSPSGFAYLANTPGALAAVVEAQRSTETRIRDEIAAECCAAGIEGTFIVRSGNCLRAVVDIARQRQAHALIVGSRPGIVSRLLPSATSRLVSRAGRPVVLVP